MVPQVGLQPESDMLVAGQLAFPDVKPEPPRFVGRHPAWLIPDPKFCGYPVFDPINPPMLGPWKPGLPKFCPGKLGAGKLPPTLLPVPLQLLTVLWPRVFPGPTNRERVEENGLFRTGSLPALATTESCLWRTLELAINNRMAATINIFMFKINLASHTNAFILNILWFHLLIGLL